MATSELAKEVNKLTLDECHIIVAAIDFGTTFSGYAFSFKSSKDAICMNKNWGASLSCESYKAPTCVLTSPGGEFHSFGYDAEDEFNQLEEDDNGPDGFNLYRNFKMLLHKQGAKLSSTVVSTAGHVTPAIEIFAMVLEYLKTHMLNVIKLSVKTQIDRDSIRWILTVPAIWSDESKWFMREAAFRAGLISEVTSGQLLIALEPEAASLYCRGLDINHFRSGPEKMIDVKFKTGDTILVIDAGGGTIDITAHEVTVTGHVKELIPPTGGPWGGMTIDAKFVSLLCKIVGTDFINKFKSEFPQQWFNLMICFEKAKKGVEPKSKSLRLSMPFSFEQELRDTYGKGFGEFIKAYNDQNIKFANGIFVIKIKKVQEIYDEVTTQIISHVKEIIQDIRLHNLNYILLVGGFGESKFLQQACLVAFADKFTVLLPLEAQLAIIKGAVTYGHDPLQISSRIAKQTYGCELWDYFVEGKHDPSRKMNRSGMLLCKDVFSVFIKQGENVETGLTRNFSFSQEHEESDTAITLYCTKVQPVPLYIDDPGMQKLGTVILKTNDGDLRSTNLLVAVTFGGTELVVQARDLQKSPDHVVHTVVDFLSDKVE